MDLAQPAVFGKGAGCALVEDSCDAYVKKHPAQNYYCPASNKDGEHAAEQCSAPVREQRLRQHYMNEGMDVAPTPSTNMMDQDQGQQLTDFTLADHCLSAPSERHCHTAAGML